MLRLYIFWGIFTLVLIGIGVTLMRQRRQRQKREAAAAASSANAASVAAVPSSVSSVVASTPEPAFDPGATRIHFRTPPTGLSSSVLKRDEALLPTEVSAKLVCVGGSQKGNSFSIAAAGITVGRHPENDIVITDPRVSFHHAWVGVIDRKAVLRDLGSTNGTFLNARIDSPVGEVVLNPGDTIFFGGHSRDQFLFVIN